MNLNLLLISILSYVLGHLLRNKLKRTCLKVFCDGLFTNLHQEYLHKERNSMEVNIDDALKFVGYSERSQLFYNNMFVFLELTTQKKNIRNFTVT